MAKTRTPRAAALHPLDALAGDPLKTLALILWQDRKREPDMFRKISENDMKGLADCAAYLKVNAVARIYRPEGQPAQPGVPATRGRRAIPGRPATPPKPYVIVTLVNEKTGDVVRPVENNEDDYEDAQLSADVRKARERASDYANRLMSQAKTGDYSYSDVMDAANALLVLSRT